MSVGAIFGRPCIRVVVVIREPILTVFRNDSHVAGSSEFAGAPHEQSSAPTYRVDAVSIEIRTSDSCRASDANVVGAVDAGTTGAPIHEQVIISAAFIDTGGLDRAIIGQLISRRRRADAQTGRGMQLYQVDPAPIGTEDHPEIRGRVPNQ